MHSLRSVRKRLNFLYALLGNWRAVAKIYDLPAGTVCAIAKGRNPRDPSTRTALGLSIKKEVDVCPIHGIVHIGECEDAPKKQQRNYQDLWAMPTSELKRRLDEREEI